MDIYQILRVHRDADKSELQARYLRMIDTYQIMADFAENQDVAGIAKSKLTQLIMAGKEQGLYTECPESYIAASPQIEIGAIKLALNSSKSDIVKPKGNNILEKIDALPKSAEKYYLKAIVILKIDSSFQGYKNAIVEIQNAIELDSTNEAYVGLLDAMNEQIKDYEQSQRDKMIQDNVERWEREKKSAEALEAVSQTAVREERQRFFGAVCEECLYCCCCSWM